MRLAILGLSLLVAGCSATSQGTLRNMEAYGEASMARATTADADYVVTMRNVIGFGYDLREQQTRREVALTMASAQCNSTPSFVREDALTTGNYTTGKPAITYSVFVRC